MVCFPPPCIELHAFLSFLSLCSARSRTSMSIVIFRVNLLPLYHLDTLRSSWRPPLSKAALKTLFFTYLVAEPQTTPIFTSISLSSPCKPPSQQLPALLNTSRGLNSP